MPPGKRLRLPGHLPQPSLEGVTPPQSDKGQGSCSNSARVSAEEEPRRASLPFDPGIVLSFLPVNEVFWIRYFEAFPFVSRFQSRSYISDCANFVCSCFFPHFRSAARTPEKEIRLSKQE